ncbi:unnamed protein product [Heligmosomoides polygyrus]|uniref:Ethylmalonyl-CoA decarboxylase n=1 Tax=Heligmosomoides polygyrus TaxID=6339 RepID=A0A183FVX0_HELPZ|nr:unnamed protein product [Heligmosomoides polygyrus]
MNLLIYQVSVARLHGHCLGGATEIASSCDIRLAHKDAKIGFLQSRMGIVPSWGGANFLASIVGRGTALRLMTTAPIIAAPEALELGFVDMLYNSDEDFQEIIASMLKNGAEVCRSQKAMLEAVDSGEEENKLGSSCALSSCSLRSKQLKTVTVRVMGRKTQAK